MKKVIIALSAATLLLASCNGDACKCTYKDNEGNKKTETIAKTDDTNCSDAAKTVEEKANAAMKLIGSDYKVKVSCSTVSE